MSSSTPDQPKVVYSTVDEQERICFQMRNLLTVLPWTETIFLKDGNFIAFGLNLIPSFAFYRAAHRGYKLSKFRKARMSAPFLAAVVAFQGSTVHEILVRRDLDRIYNDHTMLSFCKQALLCQCYVLPLCFFLTTSFPFVLAVGSHLIPVPGRFLEKANRKEAFKAYFSYLKPYTRSMVLTSVISQAAMALLAAMEFHQYKNLLAKFNRKYIHIREDSSSSM